MAKERTADWFKKSVPESQIDAYWTSRIRQASDPAKYSPTLVLTVPLDKDGKPDVQVFDEAEQLSTWEQFEASIRDGEFCCIVRVPALYFMPVRARGPPSRPPLAGSSLTPPLALPLPQKAFGCVSGHLPSVRPLSGPGTVCSFPAHAPPPPLRRMTCQLHSVQFFPTKKVTGFQFRKRSASEAGLEDQQTYPKGEEAPAEDPENQQAADAFM